MQNEIRERIMYCAFPTRLRHLREQVKQIARAWGYAPVIPFDIGDFEDFEGNPRIGRPPTIEFMLHVLGGRKSGCGTLGIFGISDGSMGELKCALDAEKPVRVFPGLDPEWGKMYEQLKCKYNDLLARLRGNNQLVALVGARAIGKTFWSEFLLKHFGERLKRVKNTTTRTSRNKEDRKSYQFVREEEFKKGIQEYQFLEWDKYQSNYYGSSLKEIRKVLNKTHGIFAITPRGATALNSHRLEINLTTILLVPELEKVLLQNFDRRGITDPKKHAELLGDAKNFTLPPEVRHQKVVVTGDTEKDAKNILKIVEPLIYE